VPVFEENCWSLLGVDCKRSTFFQIDPKRAH
jgi:hypothetical protein